MTEPIPVFSFVFAAYAATCGGVASKAGACAIAPLSARAPFRVIWRKQLARGGAVFAKVGLIEGSGPQGLQLSVGATGEARQEFWVGGIVESGLGFVGAAVDARHRPAGTAPGRRVHFHVINVLDWRIGGCPAACPRTNAPCAHRKPAGEFSTWS